MGHSFLTDQTRALSGIRQRANAISLDHDDRAIPLRHRAVAVFLLAGLALLLLRPSPAAAADSPMIVASAAGDLTELSLDQLLNIEVTSVSKRSEKLQEAAAAVYVLTGEEMHRQGVRSIAEALRLVPGLQVARSDSRSYAISARGFNSGSADKLQVLIDGRSVYTPLTSAVFWDVLDTNIEDIDRIEVIRGPGASLWGANAVNGVINIVTRNSSETLGTVMSGGIGTEDRARAEFRSGTRIGDNGNVRVYAKARDQNAAVKANGSDAQDSARTIQGGLRSDWTLASGQQLMVSADVYADRFNTPPSSISNTTRPTSASGRNILARWGSGESTDTSWSLQGYYDAYERLIPDVYEEARDTFDLDFQQQFSLTPNNVLIYGLAYHRTTDETGGPPYAVVFVPQNRTLTATSAFVQDQWSFGDGRYTITAGSKFEHDDFSRLSVQPSLRFGWKVAPHAFTWAAVSRAVRRPNRINSDIAINCPSPGGFPGICGPGLFRIGNPSIEPEKLTAYEWGLRLWNEHQVSIDLATFYNVYTHLLSTESAPFGTYQNKMSANSHGAELVMDWKPRVNLTLQASYAYLRINAEADADSLDKTTAPRIEGSDPKHQAGLRVAWQPMDLWLVDGFLRYVGGLSNFSIPAYTELNLRVAHQLTPGLEISLSGQNLLAAHHPEFGAANTRSEVERSALLGFTWRWQ